VSTISPEDAKAYLERWELVRQVEAAELQGTPWAVKFQQLASLVASSGLFRVADYFLGRPRLTRDIDALVILPESDWQSAVGLAEA
jgi:hypothetical protein